MVRSRASTPTLGCGYPTGQYHRSRETTGIAILCYPRQSMHIAPVNVSEYVHVLRPHCSTSFYRQGYSPSKNCRPLHTEL